VSGNTWYYSGDTAFAGVDVGIFPASPTDTRYVFVSWTGDASGTVFSQSSAILMNAPKTATATWKTQYKLTIVSSYATTSCSVPSCWYDTGDATATASIDQTNVAAGAGTRHHFTGWSGGASGTGATSNAITMSGPKIATAQWVTQYLVTVTVGQSGVTASCSNADCWYDSGASNANVALSTNGVSLGAGARTGFIRWSGDASGTDWTRSDPILIDQPKAVTVVWQTQYQLTLTGDDPANGGTSVVTQVGSPGNDGWYVSGDAAQLSLTSPVPGGSGIRWKFTSWGGAASGTSTSASVIMSGPKSVTLAWQKQFQVTVGTDPANVATVSITPTPDAGGWVNDGATIQVSVGSEVSAAGKTYVFVSWTGASGGATGTATITGPTTLTATFREKGLFESPAVLGGLIAAIVAALLIAILFLWRRKKSSGAEMPPATAGAPPAPAEESTMQCPSCGMTIPAKAGPCPICGTEVAPPAAPAGDERIAKLTEAYQSGRISKEQYQTNLKRLRGNT